MKAAVGACIGDKLTNVRTLKAECMCLYQLFDDLGLLLGGCMA